MLLNTHSKLSASTTVLTVPEVQGVLLVAVVLLLQIELKRKMPQLN